MFLNVDVSVIDNSKNITNIDNDCQHFFQDK